MHKKLLLTILVCLLGIGALAVAACGSEEGSDDGTSSATPTAAATGKPFKLGFNEGFTGFMATDATLAEHGILTAMAMVDNQWLGRPLEYVKADNASDPVQAVDKARQLVESKGIDVMLGPIYSPANAAVTDYLAKSGGIPSISIFGQPIDNMKTANKLSFIPSGFYTFEGYYFGKYAAEELGYKTARAINYEDTASRQIQAGFDKGFAEAGGEVLSTEYVPPDVVDFSSYLPKLTDADCVVFWIYGNGAGPFVKQYRDYGLAAPLLMPMCSNLNEPAMAQMGDAVLDIVGCDFYSPVLDNELNQQFVAKYNEMWDGEQPNMDSFGGWVAVNLFLQGVKATDGDTTPKALIKAMSTASFDTPAGTYTMSPYKDAFVGTGNFFILKTERVDGGRIAWAPVYTYENALHTEIE